MGGGVGVDAMTGGVLDCWMLGDGEAGALTLEKLTGFPWASLMTMGALFLGRAKVDDETMAGAVGCAGRW